MVKTFPERDMLLSFARFSEAVIRQYSSLVTQPIYFPASLLGSHDGLGNGFLLKKSLASNIPHPPLV